MDTTGSDYKPVGFVNGECVVSTSSFLLFIFQMIIILIVISTSIYNITKGSGDTNMWTALLSSSIGYVLPNPKLKYSSIEGRK